MRKESKDFLVRLLNEPAPSNFEAPAQRIGLSATVEPVEEVAAFLTGSGRSREVTVVRPESTKRWDITVTLPVADLQSIEPPADAVDDVVAELVGKIAPTPLPVLRLTKLALVRAAEARGLRDAVNANRDLSAILNATETPEGREFARIASEQGLKAALAWRDSRYGESG